mmetsp:Transcript_51823/g.116723  ORF Transcript_51823/g.116723 Transcript_51823/m.116723 type:complete len:633 (+) Transcript_51823:90-1988(+)
MAVGGASGKAPLIGDEAADKKRKGRFKISTYMPIFKWLPAYDWRQLLLKDISCGITLGCVLIGQSLAHASLSGVGVIHGPYSCMLPPLLYAVFGSCSQASVGTGGLLALLTGTALAKVGDMHERDHAAAILCVEVGLIMALMGIFQLSFLVRFLSRPALSGFITGSALLIIKAMIMPMLGLPADLQKKGFQTVMMNPADLRQSNLYTIALSTIVFAFLYNAKKILPGKMKDMKELMALIATGVFGYLFAEKYGVQLVGSVPSGLPHIKLPITSMQHIGLCKELLPEAGLIALVCFISSFASAKKCGMKGGYQVSALNELLALGLANIFGGLSGGVPTQIGLSRSALAYDMGVQTPLGANVFVAIVVVSIVQVFGPVLGYVPKCILNVIIANAAVGLFEFGHGRKLWSYHDKIGKRKDWITWVVAFASTLILGAFEGILIAVAISLIFALRQLVNPKMDILGAHEKLARLGEEDSRTWVSIDKHPTAVQTPGVLVIRIDGPIFYANCERFQDHVSELELEAALKGEPLGAIIFAAASIPFIDSTAIEVLDEMLTSFKTRGVQFYIAQAYGGTREFITRALGKKLLQTDLHLNIDGCVQLYKRTLKTGASPRTKKNRAQSVIMPLPVIDDGDLP